MREKVAIAPSGLVLVVLLQWGGRAAEVSPDLVFQERGGTAETLLQQTVQEHHERYLVPGMFGNLNNQRISVLNGLQLARQWGLTFVLPRWCLHTVHNPGIGAEGCMPFDYFYKIEPLRQYARSLGFDVAESLPEHLAQECEAQQGDKKQVLGVKPNEKTLLASNTSGLICLSNKATFYLTKLPGFERHHSHDAVPYLQPSAHWEGLLSEAGARLQQQVGHDGYAAVHIRIEEDWVRACVKWKCNWYGLHCMVGDVDTLDTLRGHYGLPTATPLLLLTGAPLAELKHLCSVYPCITKDALVKGLQIPESLQWQKATSRAFFDFQLARNATSFYGNRYSTFSLELHNEFNISGRSNAAHWLNMPDPECDAGTSKSRLQ